MFNRIVMMLLIVVSTAGCVTERLARNDCDWAQPISPSRQDVLTRQTKEQIAAHNEVGARICGWRPIVVEDIPSSTASDVLGHRLSHLNWSARGEFWLS
jgi:hypothetical protein